MKVLEQFIIQARSRFRAERARRGRPGRPARLWIRLDDLDAPGPVPAPTLNAGRWHETIVRVVEWAGALPVHVVARADHPLAVDVLRFAHRLECPTTFRTSARGLDARRAEALVDGGLDTAVVRVAGVTDATQGAVLGETVDDAKRALAALMEARGSRAARLETIVEVPLDARSARELPRVFAWARQAGADGARIAPPWRGVAPDPGAIEALAWAEAQRGRFARTPAEAFATARAMVTDGEPGAARTEGRCPVGGLRMELLPDGTARSCPFLGAPTDVGEVLADAWAAQAPYRNAIARCGRRCAHPDLLP